MQNWQDFVALAIVTVVGLLLLYQLIQAGRGKGSPGCGCTSCPGCHSQSDKMADDVAGHHPSITLDTEAFKDSAQKR